MKTNRFLVLGVAFAAIVAVLALRSPKAGNRQTSAPPSLVSTAQAAPVPSTTGKTAADPGPQSNITSDSLIHGAIMREIIQEKLADVMSNVRVTVRDGAVTLKGTVPTEFFRQRVGAIAATVVSSGNVDNEVVVAN